MIKSPLTACLALLAVASTSCLAQRIDTSQSRNIALTDAQSQSGRLPATDQQTPLMSPVMTRAMAHRGADGTLTVDCKVQASPLAARAHPELPRNARRKEK